MRIAVLADRLHYSVPVRGTIPGDPAMIRGVITPNREAIIRIGVRGSGGQKAQMDAVIDTGFNGFLTLPVQLIADLALPFAGATRAIGDLETSELRCSLSNLSRKEARLLIRLRTAGMEVEDFPFLETHLLKHSAGNPLLLLRRMNRLRKESVITTHAVRRVHYPGGRDQLDLTPALLVLLSLALAAKFFALGLGDPELYMLAGIGMALVIGAKFFLYRMRR